MKLARSSAPKASGRESPARPKRNVPLAVRTVAGLTSALLRETTRLRPPPPGPLLEVEVPRPMGICETLRFMRPRATNPTAADPIQRSTHPSHRKLEDV